MAAPELLTTRRLSRKRFTAGISLIEALLILVLLSCAIITIIMILIQASTIARDNYIRSTQSILINNLADKMSPERPTFYSDFDDDQIMQTHIVESNRTIPYIRTVEKTNSDAFNRNAYIFLYNNATDAQNSPYLSYQWRRTASELRINVGQINILTDNSLRQWLPGSSITNYNGANKQLGFFPTNASIASFNSGTIVNTTGYNSSIYKAYRDGAGNNNIELAVDVPNSRYVVKLYFAENDSTVTGTSPNRRLIDIYLENQLMNLTPYSPYEVTGGSNRANIQVFTIPVTDHVLNISIQKNLKSNKNAILSGVSIMRALND